MSADSTSGDQEPPKIKFPCLYPIKIIGKAADDFQVSVIAAVERYTGTIMSDLYFSNNNNCCNWRRSVEKHFSGSEKN